MIINIVNGDFKERQPFIFKDNKIIFSNVFKNEVIPICEVVEIKKEEVIKNYCYVTFTLSDKKSFIAKIKDSDYAKIYESFINHGNRPEYITLPQASKSSPIIKYGLLFLFFVLIVIPIIIGIFEGYKERAKSVNKDNEVYAKNDSEPVAKVTQSEFGRICRYAIALDFGKDPSIVKIRKPYDDTSMIVAVGYTRKLDKTVWNFECKIDDTNNKVLWRNNPGTNIDNIGRWRDGTNGGEGNDSLITYKVTSNKIQVTRNHSDGGSGDGLTFTRE
ncbi:hypothetical protein [Aeromonas hydrophila]|uniref:hypothetical protein n=1 Tax=Aeromonas hydrophila TaxID=644 RepID=UPI0030CCB818